MSEISPRDPRLQAYNTIDPALIPRRRSRLLKYAIVGNYQLQQTIGIGGFAKVHKASHIPTGETVAVKVVSLRKLTDSLKNDLNREIEIHRSLVHQNIAQIYQVLEQNEKIYIFMEYCPKGELFDFINQKGPLPVEQARKIFCQIYSAVCYLHQNSIAHRDIKTENILLDENGNAKLIDFGLSNFYGGKSLPEFLSTFCGSPSYLSPEMIKKGKYEPKMIDVWCLGVTLYAMMKAELPFYDSDPNEQQRKIKSMHFKSVGDVLVDELLNSIFVPADGRIALEEIKNSTFMKEGKSYCPNCLSLEAQNYAIDEQVVEEISKEYRLCPQKVIESIKGKKLNSLYGFYYLTLQKHRAMGKQSCYDVRSSSFMKSRDLKCLRKMERRHQTIDLARKELEPNTAASTPKSIMNHRRRLTTIDIKKREMLEYKMFDPFGGTGHFHRGVAGASMIKRMRRNSEDSPSRQPRIEERKVRKLRNMEI